MRSDVNFFSVYRAAQDTDANKKFNITAISVLAGSLVIIIAVTAVLLFSDMSVNRLNRSNQEYLKSSEASNIESGLAKAKTKLSAINQYKQAAQRVSEGFKSLPEPDSDMLSLIASKMPGDVTVTDITYSSDTLTITGTCTDNLSPAVFVHSLEATQKFNAVNYKSVAKKSDGSTFDFSINLLVRGGE